MTSQTVTLLTTCVLIVLAKTSLVMADRCPQQTDGPGYGLSVGQMQVSGQPDQYEDTVSLILALGWTHVFFISDEEVRLESAVTQLESQTLQYHTTSCDDLDTRGHDLEVRLLRVLKGLGQPNVVVVGTPCLLVLALHWLSELPEEAGHMSPLVQDARWLLVGDSHVMRSTNMTSFLVNHVAFMVNHNETQGRQMSLHSLTWTHGGRHLVDVRRTSQDCLDVTSLYPNTDHGLNGMTLRVAINEWTPYIMGEERDGKTVYRGYSMDLLDILAASLNFSYRLVYPADGEWGDYRDGKWTGVVGQIARKEVDFSVAPLTTKYDRSRVADWSGPYTFRYTGLAVAGGVDSQHQITALLRPFTSTVYLVIGGLLLGFPLVFGFLLAVEARLHRQSRCLSVVHIGEFLLGSFLKEIVPSDLLTVPGVRRPLVASWCVLGLLVTAAYMSQLTALLVGVSPSPPIASMADMVRAPGYRWGVVGGTALLASFRASNDSVKRAVYDGIMTFAEDDPDVLSLDAEVHRRKVLAGGYVYIGEVGLLDIWATTDCTMSVIRENVIGMETYNCYTGQESVLTARIDAVLLRLKAAGILEQLKSVWWPTESQCDPDTSTQTPLPLAVMQGVFYLAGLGLVLGLASLGVERIVGFRRRANLWCPTWLVTSSQPRRYS